MKAKNKPQGRKRKSQQQHSKKTNWQSPFLWSQIEAAAVRAGKPWSPRTILKEAKSMDPIAFERLTEQVIGQWINPGGRSRGVCQWSEAVLV